MTSSAELADQLAAEAVQLEREITEIDLLVTQARTEAGRHETRRATAAEKLAKLGEGSSVKEAVDLANQVGTLTRRAALMDGQLEILEGKKKSIARLHESIQASADRVRELDGRAAGPASGSGALPADDDEEAVLPVAVSRLVLSAQEDLRREIARAMHDGPAQSLTNIVLQAEIVERLVTKEPGAASGELRQLVAMVQQTLEATKSFIFDVRPMVLDDLGLVPTLRRSARDRGRRAGSAVAFESMGVDRRLPVEMESGIFRIVDEAMASYLAARPDRISLSLDWGDSLVVTLRAARPPKEVPGLEFSEPGETMPAALEAMVADRRAKHEAALDSARKAAIIRLPARLQKDLIQRAATIGLEAEILEDGSCLRLTVVVPGSAPDADEPDAIAD
jgi:two-component system sensor histidine kinase DegS